MCPEVFVLDEYEKRIMKFLALHGPLNLNQLSKFTTKYADSLDRWGIKRRLHGSSRFMGLIPFEYVEERITNNHRYGKDEKKYYLTIKGIIAINSIIPLEKNFFFKKYSEFYANIIKIPNIQSFFDTFVEVNMRLMVAWHFLNGIQLTKQRSSSFYYMGFFFQLRSSGSLDISFSDKKIKNEFKEILKKCLVYHTIIDIVTHGKLHFERTPLSLVDWKKTIRVTESEHRRLGRVWEWPFDLDDIRFFEEFGMTKGAGPFTMPMINLSEFYSKETKDRIDLKLKELDYKTNWRYKSSDYYAN
jgi:hypothetical protein